MRTLKTEVKERRAGSMHPGALHENCIASTSIFILKIETRDPSYEGPTADALAPTTDEGRERLRQATGSCRLSVDPWISEWGNPALERVLPRSEHIGPEEGTG
eukprot:TRINITY_DN3175_c0_g3_i1.p5 TRINITY_DN3175_c0_g3~~TRINITY_DN3175_c0_g3_i1.p5  ORF type:complete len:103 (+),score=5.30 TRINITY_DN3175_c0_g3_i1:2-310(+)